VLWLLLSYGKATYHVGVCVRVKLLTSWPGSKKGEKEEGTKLPQFLYVPKDLKTSYKAIPLEGSTISLLTSPSLGLSL
jgi:hypothetical protein